MPLLRFDPDLEIYNAHTFCRLHDINQTIITYISTRYWARGVCVTSIVNH